MNQDNKVEIVQAMQDYIKKNIAISNFSLKAMYEHIGYSERHAKRLFCELLHMTPNEYVRRTMLTSSTKKLLETEDSIVDIALDTNYETHEGYTRAFKKSFQIGPAEYRKSPRAIPLFVQYPVSSYHAYLNHKERLEMDKNTMICTVTPVEKPKRKLIILRSASAHDYWSFCEENGCDWEGILNSIPEKTDTAAIVELPEFLVKEGTTSTAAGVEVPFSYNTAIPEKYEIIEIDSGIMLYFKSEPFEDEKDFGIAIDCVFKAYETYNPTELGYSYENGAIPKFNYGAFPETGAKLAIPVKKI
ncbi:AraC-like DNA-binding protein [Kineothrix alysoides]|uniref:AraC-like DNA-binding protein n=1 Tax=Kineothrix alysoides TaxID=1469948 RepID=A0A4R1QQX3_9FIRM|nr:AraC family transcriptional regulator [Kineothrix alysoides]TCL56236.1 AraC-like DNA-binding protein [Kineothrix alysoides]